MSNEDDDTVEVDDMGKKEAELIAKIDLVSKALSDAKPKGMGHVGRALKRIVGIKPMIDVGGTKVPLDTAKLVCEMLVTELECVQAKTVKETPAVVVKDRKPSHLKLLQKETRPMCTDDVLSALLRLQSAIRCPVRNRYEAHRLIVRIRQAQKMVRCVKVKVKVALKTCGGGGASDDRLQPLATDNFNSAANAAVQCLASARFETDGGIATAVSTLREFNSELSATISIMRRQKDGSVVVTPLGTCDVSEIPKVRKAVAAVVKSLGKGAVPLPGPGVPKKRGKRRSIRLEVSQEQVAEDTGIAPRTIQYWESGEVTPLLNYTRMVRANFQVYHLWLQRYLDYKANKEKAERARSGRSKRVRFEEGGTDAIMNNGGLNGGCSRLPTEEVRPEDRKP